MCAKIMEQEAEDAITKCMLYEKLNQTQVLEIKGSPYGLPSRLVCLGGNCSVLRKPPKFPQALCTPPPPTRPLGKELIRTERG